MDIILLDEYNLCLWIKFFPDNINSYTGVVLNTVSIPVITLHVFLSMEEKH